MAALKQVFEQAQSVAPATVEWTRPPRDGEFLEGLSRSAVFGLIRAGKIRSAAIKQPGAARTGMRLVHIPSLRAFIASHAEGAEANG